MLPRRIPKQPKRASRWRSQAHCNFVRGFACCNCGSMTNVQAAHVRYGSGAGMAQKPDDWRTVPMCSGPFANALGEAGCHTSQHDGGEPSFWEAYRVVHNQTVEQLIEELIASSPKRREIQEIRSARGPEMPNKHSGQGI